MKHTSKLLALAAGAAGAAVLATAGWAYWTAGGHGSAAASVGTLNPPVIGTTAQPVQGVGTLRVNWSASTGTPAPTGYYVQRFVGSMLDGPACGSSPAELVAGPSCDDDGLTASGPYSYKVTAVFRSWTAPSAASNAVAVVLDATPPAVSAISLVDANPTNRGNVSWTVTFTEPVTGVDAGDFALARQFVAGGTVTGVTGSNTTWTVSADTGTGDGTLGLNLVDNDTIVDGVGNSLGGTGAGNGNFAGQLYSIDKTAPTVLSILRDNSNPTRAQTVSWTITLTESLGVTGVGADDFALVPSAGVTGASTETVTGSYTVTVSTGTGDGTLGLNLVDDDSIVDRAGNPLGGPGVGNGNFAGEIYTIDKTAPTTTDDAPPGWTNAASVAVALTPVDAGGSGVAHTYFTTDGSDPRTSSSRIEGLAVSVTSVGTTTIRYFSSDAAGNTEAVRTTVVRIDRTAPATTALLTPAPNAAGWNKADVQVSLTPSDGASGVASTSYTTTGAQTIASNVYTGPFTITADGTTSITFSSTDAAGNTEATKTQTVKLDKTNPTGSITTPSSGSTVGGVVTVTAAVSDTTAGVASVQFRLKPNGGSFADLGAAMAVAPYSLNWDTTTAANGSYSLQAVATDHAGNSFTTTTVTVTVTNSYTVTLAPTGTKTAGTAFNVTITAKDASGTTVSGYSGTRTILFTGPANSPAGTSPTSQASVSFTGGVGTANVTLVKAETVSLVATQQGGGPTGSVSVTVSPGTASKLAWTNITTSGTPTAVPSPCFYTCGYDDFGRGNQFKANVIFTDAYGNTVSNIGAGRSVTVTRSGSGSISGSPLSFPSSGPAQSTTQFTYTSHNGNNWGPETVTARSTNPSTGIADATAVFTR